MSTVGATSLFDLAGATGEHGDAMNGQWRLAEIQLANWGTFDGQIYRIPIARRGHLITGPSGSGKSSLLDAIAAVLTPDKWLRFNEAAQGVTSRADRRTPVSYVRGAWSRTSDELEDRVVPAYLRGGPTWSGIVLRFENGLDRPVSACRLFFAKGTSTSPSDLADLCLLDRDTVDLRDLELYARTGLETRRLKKDRPEAIITSGGAHARFYAKLRGVFGIGDEGALQLLHKTQSAKSLDSLDQLFRDYMLERPDTFGLAETAVTQFEELQDAHDHVVQLRLQRDLLLRLKDAARRFDDARGAADRATHLIDAVAPYRVRRGLALTTDELAAVNVRIGGAEADVVRAEANLRAADEDLEQATRRLSAAGGDEAAHLQARIEDARRDEKAKRRRRDQLEQRLRGVGISPAPADAEQFAELVAHLDLAPEEAARGASHAEQDRLSGARRAVAAVQGELASLRAHRSTVPERLAVARQRIADAAGLPPTALPFVAELLDVREEFASWAGAIERVLRPFALTMLVRSEHLPEVRRWVDANDIGARLVYEEARLDDAYPSPARTDRSLIHRVRVADGPFAAWLQTRLSQRYDVACVDHPDELQRYERAVTIRGQIRTRDRYEKDDRRRLDDRSSWVLGDPEGKFEALVSKLVEVKAELDAAEAIVETAQRRQQEAQRRLAILETIRTETWDDVDVPAAAARVAALVQRWESVTRDDADLRRATEAVDEARAARDAVRARQGEASLALSTARNERQSLTAQAEELQAQIDDGLAGPVDEATWAELDRRFSAVRRNITRLVIADVSNDVVRRLQHQLNEAQAAASAATGEVTGLATEFRRRWESVAVDLRGDVADRHGYVEILDRIVAHGLPEHEATFLRLLRERSRDMIGELVSDILRAPHEVAERVGPVNASLRRSPFDEGRWLRLRVKTRRSDTVNRFIADLRSIAEGSWNDDDLDAAERRFTTMSDVMRRFASSEHVDRAWRTQVLDTRLHVTFLAEEIDEHGHAHATYDSGAAMSGGQQQKLVVFCLAAALRYQLADAEDVRPRYGTVVLDEAFDKADTRYTRMALDVFSEFGFHLVLATPQKLLQTIEPYVGGATSIENPTRRRSEVADIAWAEGAPPSGGAA